MISNYDHLHGDEHERHYRDCNCLACEEIQAQKAEEEYTDYVISEIFKFNDEEIN